MKLIIRCISALVLSVILSSINFTGSCEAVKVLFTVLGISFSIAMSIIISFDLSSVLNDGYRTSIRHSLTYTRDAIVFDFILSTILLFVSILDKDNLIKFELFSLIKFDIQTFTTCVVLFSIFYEIYNFKKIHELHDQLSDRIIKEKKEN